MQISYKHICKITIPVLVSLLVEYLIGFTDTAYLGRVGETELAASALAGTYYMIIYMIGFGFSIGAQILIARYNGSRQYSRTGEVFTQGTIFLLLVATLLFTLSYLYLDVYVKGVRKVESLGLYLVPETTPIDRQQNNHARQVAEKIKAERILALQNHGVRQWDKVKRSCIALVDFLKEYEQEKFGFSTSTLKGRRDLRLKIETYLKEANCPDIVLANVDVDFCRGFIDFLRYAKNGVRKDGSVISNGAAHHHQAVLNGALNKAVRDGILSANPLKSISAKEKYQPTESMREYLTLEEMKAAMAAPCPHEDVKRAFLFSCFTGLRLSDVRSLTWGKIVKAPDGKTLYIRIKMQKTQKLINVPLSKEAVDCLNPKENPEEPIFTLPTGTSNIERNIEKWMQNAQIDKHITYHCSRHTAATMLLTLGADIYTTSKLLGHANVNTTAIYAKIVDQKKVETVNLVDDFFSKQPQTEGNR